MREQRIEFRGESGAHFRRRAAEARERELPGAEQRLAQFRRLTGEVEPAERLDDPRLVGFVADAGEGDQRLDRGLRQQFGERAVGPLGGGLAFDGDAGRETNEAIRTREVRPRLVDRLRSRAFVLQGFE